MEKEELFARKDAKTGKSQLLNDHSRNVSRLCGASCEAVGFMAFGHLIGLIHDMGKASDAWQTYLDKDSSNEKIDHSTAGAYWIWENSKSPFLKKCPH